MSTNCFCLTWAIILHTFGLQVDFQGVSSNVTLDWELVAGSYAFDEFEEERCREA